jgi:hypothetical protein
MHHHSNHQSNRDSNPGANPNSTSPPASSSESQQDSERNYYAGAPGRGTSSRVVTGLATAVAALSAWTLWSYGAASMARRAEAGPPAPSALTIQKRQESAANDPLRVLDPGLQRDELLSEVKALRTDVATLKDLLRSGQMRAEVSNLADLKPKEVKLEIDYAKLREALRQP